MTSDMLVVIRGYIMSSWLILRALVSAEMKYIHTGSFPNHTDSSVRRSRLRSPGRCRIATRRGYIGRCHTGTQSGHSGHVLQTKMSHLTAQS